MNGNIVIDTPEGIKLFHMLQLKYALKLECIGMRHSKGSVYAYIKRHFGMKGSKHKVLEQFTDLIESVKHAEQQ